MTERSVLYVYEEYDLGCGCCSDSDSTYSVWEDGIWIIEDIHCPLMENESDIREYLVAYEPFTIHEDTYYF